MRPEDRPQLGNWRMRRLLACRAVDDLQAIIGALGTDDGTDLPPNDPGPGVINPDVAAELGNSATALLRMILLLNDGRVSPHKLRRF